MKTILFSRHFPKGHPKEGQPTHFVEKIEACLADIIPGWEMSKTFTLHEWEPYYNCTMPKGHTIRAGSRFKPGDMASLRVWSGLPRRSKQIEFAQVEVKKTWDIVISDGNYSIDTIQQGSFIPNCDLEKLANNNGLHVDDFWSWFNVHPKKKDEVFKGQIICWSDSIEYVTPEPVTENTEQELADKFKALAKERFDLDLKRGGGVSLDKNEYIGDRLSDIEKEIEQLKTKPTTDE